MTTAETAGRSAMFSRPHRIRFSECDPAGIVFFPQYFVMLNGLIEDWFDRGLGLGYRTVISDRRIGLPTVRLDADFKAVSRFGDDVVLHLDVERIGKRSLTLHHRCTGAATDDIRMSLRQTIVTTSLDTHLSIDIPADLRQALERR